MSTNHDRDAWKTWGRRSGLLLFWFVAIYTAAAGAFSLVYEVFVEEESVHGSCDHAMKRLRNELIDRVQSAFSEDDSYAQIDQGWAEWDRAYRSLGKRCPVHDKSLYADLGRMRSVAGGLLLRAERKFQPLVRRSKR